MSNLTVTLEGMKSLETPRTEYLMNRFWAITKLLWDHLQEKHGDSPASSQKLDDFMEDRRRYWVTCINERLEATKEKRTEPVTDEYLLNAWHACISGSIQGTSDQLLKEGYCKSHSPRNWYGLLERKIAEILVP